ncbi:MAG: hypothetical protein GF329_10810 [Candidatus Lokiarchaeota archaeon]|nr:hypothetical protein [Candidatus Lokiarchaeota archaeon]
MKHARVDLGWCEAIIAHIKSQKMLIKGGYTPVGFLPHKDKFLGKNESDLIFVWYNHEKDIMNKRRKDVKILPEILPLYNYASDWLPEPLNKPQVESWEQYNIVLHEKVSVTIENKGNNYIEMTLRIDADNYMTFEVNQEINMAENFKISVQEGNKEAFDSLLYVVNEIFRDQLDYIELWVSAYEPEHQKICMMLGFIPAGYIPAIEVNDEGKREDKVAFVKSKSYPKMCNHDGNNLKLMDRIIPLFDLYQYNRKVIKKYSGGDM